MKDSEKLMVYINGEMVPLSNAKISVCDRNFLYGDGVFEGIKEGTLLSKRCKNLLWFNS